MSKTVFAAYYPGAASIVRVWADSWALRGWRPQLLSQREVADKGSARMAMAARRGKLLVQLTEINFSFSPRGGRMRRAEFGRPRWETASVVRFPLGVTEEQIKECGRWP